MKPRRGQPTKPVGPIRAIRNEPVDMLPFAGVTRESEAADPAHLALINGAGSQSIDRFDSAILEQAPPPVAGMVGYTGNTSDQLNSLVSTLRSQAGSTVIAPPSQLQVDMLVEGVRRALANRDFTSVASLSDAAIAVATPSQKAVIVDWAVRQKSNLWHKLGLTKLINEPDLTPLAQRVFGTVDHPDHLDTITAHVGVRKLRKYFSDASRQVMRSSLVQRLRGKIVPGDYSQFSKFLEKLTRTRPEGATKTEMLLDDKVLPSLLSDIENAKESIDIQLYIMSGDDISGQVAAALAKKAKAGVQVRVLLDGFGSKPKSLLHKAMNKMMTEAGVDVRFKPADLTMSHLDHRKIWVFDGKVGYTGGANLGHHYHGEWRDQQTRLQGGVVPQLEEIFQRAWRRVDGPVGAFDRKPPRADFFPPGTEKAAHVVHHDGGGADENIKTAYLRAISTAKDSVRIANPYFADADIVDALCQASRRGVEVELVIPRSMDSQILLDAARMHYQPLIDAGVTVREYIGKMAHHKVAVFDDVVATVGSSNLDTRSFENNDEANVFVVDEGFAKQVRHDFFDLHRADSPAISDAKTVEPKTAVYRYVLSQSMLLL